MSSICCRSPWSVRRETSTPSTKRAVGSSGCSNCTPYSTRRRPVAYVQQRAEARQHGLGPLRLAARRRSAAGRRGRSRATGSRRLAPRGGGRATGPGAVSRSSPYGRAPPLALVGADQAQDRRRCSGRGPGAGRCRTGRRPSCRGTLRVGTGSAARAAAGTSASGGPGRAEAGHRVIGASRAGTGAVPRSTKAMPVPRAPRKRRGTPRRVAGLRNGRGRPAAQALRGRHSAVARRAQPRRAIPYLRILRCRFVRSMPRPDGGLRDVPVGALERAADASRSRCGRRGPEPRVLAVVRRGL